MANETNNETSYETATNNTVLDVVEESGMLDTLMDSP